VTEVEDLRLLAEKYGVPGVDLGEVVILTEDLEIIPREVCETHSILPVMVRGDHIFLAMANPHDTRAVDEIEFVTGKKVYPYAAVTHVLTRAIEAAYDARARKVSHYVGPNVSEARLRELGIDPKRKSGPLSRASSQSLKAPSSLMPAITAPTVAPDLPPPTLRRPDPEPAVPGADEPGEEGATATSAAVRGSAGRYSTVASKLVLVVDDEDDIRAMLKRVLVAQGHRVIEAATGPLALQMVKQHVPDLLVLDAMLPGLHGFDVARRLKASERYGAIPIIMISAVYRGWRVAEDLKTSYGIFAYLEKPFRLAEVVEATTRALAARQTDAPPAGPDLDQLSAEAAKALDEGVAAYRLGDIDRAIDILQRGTKLDPLASRLHFHLALLYGKKDQVFDGIAELEMVIELNPKHFPALKNLALLYERAGFKNRAIEAWERAVHAAPDAVNRAQVKERLVQLL